MTGAIHILNASRLRGEDVAAVAETAGHVLGVPATVGNATLDLAKAYDDSRGQYSSAVLLAEILSAAPGGSGNGGGGKRIAIVDVDLFIPVLTFIFGEAQFGGEIAIVSIHRLLNRFYGLPDNGRLLLSRLEKEVIHELGHTFGLYHCRQFECVMRTSTYVEEIDLKKAQFCGNCTSSLHGLHAQYGVHAGRTR